MHSKNQNSNLTAQAPFESTYTHGKNFPFQRWFKFKEAFSPQLVYGVIDRLPVAPRLVADCFAGSGTTALSCQLVGVESQSIEVNPLMQDVIEAKLTPACGGAFLDAVQKASRRARKLSISLRDLRKRLPPTFIEPGVKDRYLYSKVVARSIEAIRQSLEAESCPINRRLMRVALAAILVELSNVRVDGKGRRYRGGWRERIVSADDVYLHFYVKTTEIAEDLIGGIPTDRAKFYLHRGDTRHKVSSLQSGIDLALFSPPYPNSFDYTDVYNVELWMLGYINSAESNRTLRRSTLRSHVQVEWPDSAKEVLDSATLRATYKKLGRAREQLWSASIPEMVNGYFADLSDTLVGLRPKLSSRGVVTMVVGNSQYAGISINTAKILSELAPSMGYEAIAAESIRSMRSSPQQKRTQGLLESMVWLKPA